MDSIPILRKSMGVSEKPACDRVCFADSNTNFRPNSTAKVSSSKIAVLAGRLASGETGEVAALFPPGAVWAGSEIEWTELDFGLPGFVFPLFAARAIVNSLDAATQVFASQPPISQVIIINGMHVSSGSATLIMTVTLLRS